MEQLCQETEVILISSQPFLDYVTTYSDDVPEESPLQNCLETGTKLLFKNAYILQHSNSNIVCKEAMITQYSNYGKH